MKVSKLFHWLYASVMFIPLLIAPIFGLAVRSDNNFQPIEVQAQEYDVVDFNQQIKNGNFENTNDWIPQYNVTFSVQNNTAYIESSTRFSQISQDLNLYKDHIYYLKFNYETDVNNMWCYFFYNYSANAIDSGKHYLLNANTEIKFLLTSSYNGNTQFGIQYDNEDDSTLLLTGDVQLFDLTQMFGVGNEPTITQFDNWFTNEYYEYTLSKKELLNVGTTTLSDTDIGSQMVYTLYNATDKYFNFNQFLGIGNLFDWFQLNVFNGTAPLGFIIFWNLLIYWLLVSIAWLIFDIAMYVPKLAHRWLDKASLE